MKKFLKSCRGALAVFMSIIIIPLITITSVFVDSSKIVLARSLAESAGDLALNTVLTDFDKELNEYFGLIASAQSTDEAIETAKQFFVDSMVSQATKKESTGGINRVTDSKIWGSDAVADFLGLQVKEGSIKIGALDNGSLANPAILKKQIVEFNKYRAPLNAIGDFYEWLTGAKKQMDELDNIADMTDKKEVFYEEESTFVEALEKLWSDLKDYDKVGIKKKYIEDLSKTLQSGGDIDNFYAALHTKIIYEYLNVYDGKGEHPVSSWQALKSGTATTYPTCTVKYTDAEGNSVSKNVPDIEKAIQDCADYAEKFKKAEMKFLKALVVNGLYSASKGDLYSNSTCEDIQYWALAEKAASANKTDIENFTAAYNSMTIYLVKMNKCYDAYKKISDDLKIEYDTKKHIYLSTPFEYYKMEKNAYNNLNNVEVTFAYSEETRSYDDLVTALKQFVENNKGTNSDGVKMYNALRNRLNGIYGTIIKGTDSYTKNGNIKKDISEKKILEYSNKLTAEYDKLQDGIDFIQECLDNIQGKGLRTSLYTKLEDYEEAFDNWSKAVDNLSGSDAAIVENDRNEINKKKNGQGAEIDDANLLLDKITESDIKALETRLTNIKTLLVNCRKAIKGLQYCGKSVMDIKDLETAMSAVRSAANKAGVSYNSFYKSDIAKLENVRSFSVPDSNTIKVTDSNNPDLTVNPPKLRSDIYEFFKNQEHKAKNSTYDKKSAKSKKNSLKSDSKKDGDFKTSASSKASKNEIKDQKELPSNLKGSDDFSSKSSKLSSVSGTVGEIFKDLATDFRDDLLVTDYIMRMFSYDTFEEELLLSCANDEGKFPSSKTTWNETGKSTYVDLLGTNMNTTWWKYNKNLRNIAINSKNNFSYLNEIEYILYGGKNKDNKTAAYCYIYAIRVACDLSPVFSCWYDAPAVISLASSISSATLGVVPVPLIQTLICIGLTCFEAAVDLSYIKAGFGIEFIKEDTNLFCNFSGDDFSDTESASGANGVGFGIVRDEMTNGLHAYLRYSDYIQLFLALKLMGSGENDVLKRTGNVIQMNMRQHNSSYLLKNSQVYFNLSAEVSIKPLMLSQPINATSSNPFKDLAEIVKFTYSMSRGY